MFKWFTFQVEGEPRRLHDLVPPVIVLLIAVVLGAGVFIASLPPTRSAAPPWNTSAFNASFEHTEVISDAETKHPRTQFVYIVENASGFDYTVTKDSRLMVLDNGSLDMNRAYEILNTVFIPAGQKARCVIQTSIVDHPTNHVDGFAIFDPQTRYKISLPKPLAAEHAPEPESTRGSILKEPLARNP